MYGIPPCEDTLAKTARLCYFSTEIYYSQEKPPFGGNGEGLRQGRSLQEVDGFIETDDVGDVTTTIVKLPRRDKLDVMLSQLLQRARFGNHARDNHRLFVDVFDEHCQVLQTVGAAWQLVDIGNSYEQNVVACGTGFPELGFFAFVPNMGIVGVERVGIVEENLHSTPSLCNVPWRKDTRLIFYYSTERNKSQA